jgi:hypothetical protein
MIAEASITRRIHMECKDTTDQNPTIEVNGKLIDFDDYFEWWLDCQTAQHFGDIPPPPYWEEDD